MAPLVSVLETKQLTDNEVISFTPVNCFLSLEELAGKVQEQVDIAWNGGNTGFF
ncbi:MAG: hypothetical protein NTU65_10540 [Cyanobacteria bacterium]|nr:hypothetical protein [Cyanobacteriota bacterium]